MAKKKQPRKPSPEVEALFDAGVKQDSVILTNVERSALEIITKRYRVGRGADALRIAIGNEADLCKVGKSKKPESAPTKSNAKGRTMEGDGVEARLFSFRSSEEDRTNIATIRERHDVIKSIAIRHAIRQEAARCTPAGQKDK